MISLMKESKFYIACGYTSMRKSIDSLYAIIRYHMKISPVSDSYFIFCNKDRNKIKIFHWDGSGYWIHYKRLEFGKFNWPIDSETAKQISKQDLLCVLGNIGEEKTTKKILKIN